MSNYTRTTVAVRGGDMTVGSWGPDDAPAVLAVHGVTANHLTWPLVAEQLPNVRLIAPDLRGRGRSNSLPGPWGMPQHAEDLAAVLDAFDASPALVLGHSMGAFASLVLANRYPDKVSSLVLVDGGLPLPTPTLPDGNTMSDDEITLAMLGPAAQRLRMTFESRKQYEDFWRVHPAFAGQWTQTIADYVNYDLDGEAPELRPSSAFDAVAADSIELRGGESVLKALAELAHPTTFISAPRGLLGEVPPLYPQAQIDQWRSKMPGLSVLAATDVNHYTIVMSEGGAHAVAAVVGAAIFATQHDEVESR